NTAAADAVQRSQSELGRSSVVDAAVRIGDMYQAGVDLPKNYVEAAKWYRKAGDQNPHAAVRLAALLLDGQNLKADYGKGMELCKSAAKKNYPPGQYCVGLIYQKGLGVRADPKEAAKWYRLAWKDARANFRLAEMYVSGEGVAVDRPEAY